MDGSISSSKETPSAYAARVPLDTFGPAERPEFPGVSLARPVVTTQRDLWLLVDAPARAHDVGTTGGRLATRMRDPSRLPRPEAEVRHDPHRNPPVRRPLSPTTMRATVFHGPGDIRVEDGSAAARRRRRGRHPRHDDDDLRHRHPHRQGRVPGPSRAWSSATSRSASSRSSAPA